MLVTLKSSTSVALQKATLVAIQAATSVVLVAHSPEQSSHSPLYTKGGEIIVDLLFILIFLVASQLIPC